MLNNPILSLVNKLIEADIPCVCWKGLSKIETALSGNADIDLHIPIDYKEDYQALALQEGWFELIPAVTFTGIEHWYKVHNNYIYHIHIYFILRTGPSFSKQYIISGFDFSKDVHLNEFGLPVLKPAVAMEIHKLRIHLRTKNFFENLFYLREKEKHEREQRFLASEDNVCLGIHYKVLGVATDYNKLTYFYNIIKRVYSKFFGAKKTLPLGFIVSFVGTDGSGKTTISSRFLTFLNTFIYSKKLSYGRPDFSFVTFPFWVLRNFIFLLRSLDIFRKSKSISCEGSSDKTTSFSKSIYYTCLSVERRYVLYKAKKLSNNGCVVVLDRCPSLVVGQMDAPKIINGSLISSILGKIEQSQYSHSHKPDLVFCLNVSLRNALVRNYARQKLNKESDVEIIDRYKLFSSYVPCAKNIIHIDANLSIDSVLTDSLNSFSLFASRRSNV